MTSTEVVYRFDPMDGESAREISGWHYDGELAFYNVDASAEYLQRFLSPETWPGVFFRVSVGHRLVGMWRIDDVNDEVRIGLAMAPELVGQGLGRGFVDAGLRFTTARTSSDTLMLEVADFNVAAQVVYRRLGFRPAERGSWVVDGVAHPFIRMRCSASTFR